MIAKLANHALGQAGEEATVLLMLVRCFPGAGKPRLLERNEKHKKLDELLSHSYEEIKAGLRVVRVMLFLAVSWVRFLNIDRNCGKANLLLLLIALWQYLIL